MYDNIIAQKIANQYREQPLVDFESITPLTDLSTLNLNWRERDLPEFKRTKHVHRLHPYLGKFIPQLVEIFLRKYKPRFVYDPFSGSGTTLVESATLGIESIGTDISAFNVMLGKAKTAQYDISLLEREVNDILIRLRTYRQEFYSDKILAGKLTTENTYLNDWFAEQSRKDLLCFRKLIKDYFYQELFKIVLSRSARSARLVTHYELDFPKSPQRLPYECFKHRRTCKPVDEAYKFIYRYTLDTLERVKEFTKLRKNVGVTIQHADSRTVELPTGIDLVFTSPPYIGLIDYHEQHRYAYELLELPNLEKQEIGPAKNGQSVEAKRQYIESMNRVFLHTRTFMKRKGLALIVVNDKYKLYNATDCGFKEIGRVDRHVNRRTGMREGAFYESILIWEKS